MRSCVVLLAVTLLFMCSGGVQAQTWSAARTGPALFEIVAVDATGDALWPYQREDLAGDGTQTESADEAAIDLRSVYADARAAQLWLRAYVTAAIAPTASSVAFFFIDSDADSGSGGAATGAQLWPAFGADPTPGGYERAVGLRGDGTLLGVFFWDAQKKQWVQQPDKPPLAAAETGSARDPLRLLGDDHGYFQVELALSVAGLDDACTGRIFVRLWNDANGKRSFGDDAGNSAAACHATPNRYGDPALLRSDACTSDASCPAKGLCRSGVCVFGYACSADSECQTGQRCSAGVCTRVVDKTCTQSADCDGLVCAAGQCIACSSSGAHACAAGLVCAPDGSCLRPALAAAAGSSAGSAATGAAGNGEARVRGGAFSCSTPGSPPASHVHWPWLTLLALRRRRRRAATGCQRVGEP